LPHVRAAEKQKEKVNDMVAGYKQATPTGFGDLRAKQNISSLPNTRRVAVQKNSVMRLRHGATPKSVLFSDVAVVNCAP